MNRPKSNGCSAPIRLGSGDEGTNWYECTKCGKPCDTGGPVPAMTQTPEQIAKDIVDGKSDKDGFLFGDLNYYEQINVLAQAITEYRKAVEAEAAELKRINAEANKVFAADCDGTKKIIEALEDRIKVLSEALRYVVSESDIEEAQIMAKQALSPVREETP